MATIGKPAKQNLGENRREIIQPTGDKRKDVARKEGTQGVQYWSFVSDQIWLVSYKKAMELSSQDDHQIWERDSDS